jgi:hypothetical protein
MGSNSRKKGQSTAKKAAPGAKRSAPRPKSKPSVSNAKSAASKGTPGKASSSRPILKSTQSMKKSPAQKKGATGRKAGGKQAELMEDDALVVCGKEVCGRKLALWDGELGDWRDGEVIKFKPSLREHLIRFLDAASASVKQEESWYELSKHRFRWLSPVSEDAGANPSYRKAPKRKAAVGSQVKVFWTGMGKWYLGKVLDYDTETKLHTVKYKDGDVQTLALRHEAVIYVDASGDGGKNAKRASGVDTGAKKATSKKTKKGSVKASSAKDGKKRVRVNQGVDEEGGAGKKRVIAEVPGKRDQNMHIAVIGARLGVYDARVKGLKRCTVENFRQDDEKYELLYDDGKSEWVMLAKSEFRYLSPRTRSGGCGPAFLNAMDRFGAEQMKLPGQVIHASGMEGTSKPAETISRRAPVREACVNWRLSIRGSDKKWYLGEVISYHPGSDRHVVLYDDGEHEVVHLPSELIAWHVYTKEIKKVFYPGKPTSMDPPTGEAAVGWRVAVFWPAENDFFRGKISRYDEFTKAFDVIYDDGDRSIVRLADDRMKWVLPPGTEYDTAPFKHRVEVIIPVIEEESAIVSEEKKTGSSKKARQPKSARKLKGSRGHASTALLGYGSFQEGARLAGRDRQEFTTEPVVVRNISSGPLLPIAGDADGPLVQSAIAVRIYLSDSSRDTDSAEGGGVAAEADHMAEDAKNNGNHAPHDVDEMMQRVRRAEESILRGFPAQMSSHSGEGTKKTPHRLDRLSLNPKMVMHRKSGVIENDSESINNLSASGVNFTPSTSPKLSRFAKSMSPLGPAPKLPTGSSSGSSEDEEDEDILISPQEAPRRTAEDAPPFGAEESHRETDILAGNDASGPIESPFGEPAIQQQALATELLDATAAFL